jgi:hypothetical protein
VPKLTARVNVRDERKRFCNLVRVFICIFLCGEAVHAAPTCQIIDSFRDFMTLSERTGALTNAQQVDVFNTHYRADNADLYVQSVIAAPGPTLDAKALVAMREARMHPEWLEADQALTLAVPKLAKRFVSAFPDFRCNFPIYLTATFGILDGAGRIVAGRPSMVVGVDTVSGYESVSQARSTENSFNTVILRQSAQAGLHGPATMSATS